VSCNSLQLFFGEQPAISAVHFFSSILPAAYLSKQQRIAAACYFFISPFYSPKQFHEEEKKTTSLT
jgi:hypothetical protein